MPKQRKSYTVKDKLALLHEMRVSGVSRRQFSKGKSISESTLRSWMKQEEKLRAVPLKLVKTVRYVQGKRKGQFQKIDEAVLKWVLARNSHGLGVKDKLIEQRGKIERDLLVGSLPDGPEKEKYRLFGASRIWVHRFKKRNRLRSRRHTTTHRLPNDFREVAKNFIMQAQNLIRQFNIKRDQIINFDQVPRYFENNKSSTIAPRGTREILLRKSAAGNHKRFTFTPFVTANGKFLHKHCLFSKRVTIPKHDARCSVDVNKTGMYNEAILKRRLNEAIGFSRGIFDKDAPVLVVLDSYSTHLKFVRLNEDFYINKKVYFHFIPPNLTGLLQPLDVAVNRSFQQYFNDYATEYQAESLRDQTNRTQHGNIKMPSAVLITKWTADWADSKTAADISKAFDLCGIVPADEFSLDNLHTPLRELLEEQFEVDRWVKSHSAIIEHGDIALDRCLLFEGKDAVLQAFFSINGEGDFKAWRLNTLEAIKKTLTEDELSKDLVRQTDISVIEEGRCLTSGLVEIYAFAHILKSRIDFVKLDALDQPIDRTTFKANLEEDNHIFAFYFTSKPLRIFYDPEYKEDDFNFVEVSDDESSDGEDDEEGEIEEQHLNENQRDSESDFPSDVSDIDSSEEHVYEEDAEEVETNWLLPTAGDFVEENIVIYGDVSQGFNPEENINQQDNVEELENELPARPDGSVVIQEFSSEEELMQFLEQNILSIHEA